MAQQFIGSDGTYIDPQVLAAARLASNNAQRYRQDSRGLGGLLGSLAAKVGDVGKAVYGTIGGGVASFKDLLESGGSNQNNLKAFTNSLYGTNNYKDATAKQLGTSINAADTLTDFIPGVALAKANPLGGAVAGGISGFGNTLKYEGADLDWNDAGNAIASGAITGAVTAGFNKGLNNATKGIGKKIAGNAIARGATSGALGGAIGAGVSGALNQQDLGTILGNMASNAASGAVTGAAMSGISQLGTKAKNAALGKFWGQTPDQVAGTLAQAELLRQQDRADDGRLNNSIPALKAQTETTEETTTGPTKYMAENSVKRPVVEPEKYYKNIPLTKNEDSDTWSDAQGNEYYEQTFWDRRGFPYKEMRPLNKYNVTFSAQAKDGVKDWPGYKDYDEDWTIQAKTPEEARAKAEKMLESKVEHNIAYNHSIKDITEGPGDNSYFQDLEAEERAAMNPQYVDEEDEWNSTNFPHDDEGRPITKTKYMNESVGKRPSVGSDDIKQLAEDYKAGKLIDDDIQGILMAYEHTTGRDYEDMIYEFNKLTGKNVGDLTDRQDEITARLQKALNSGKTKYMNESTGKKASVYGDMPYEDLESKIIANRDKLRNTTDAATKRQLINENAEMQMEMDSRWNEKGNYKPAQAESLEASLANQTKNMTKAQIIEDLIDTGGAAGYSQSQLKRMTKSQLLELADIQASETVQPKAGKKTYKVTLSAKARAGVKDWPGYEDGDEDWFIEADSLRDARKQANDMLDRHRQHQIAYSWSLKGVEEDASQTNPEAKPGRTKYMNESTGKQASIEGDVSREPGGMTSERMMEILAGAHEALGEHPSREALHEYNELARRLQSELEWDLASNPVVGNNDDLKPVQAKTLEASLGNQTKNMTKAQIIEDLIDTGNTAGYSQGQLSRMNKDQLLELASMGANPEADIQSSETPYKVDYAKFAKMHQLADDVAKSGDIEQARQMENDINKLYKDSSDWTQKEFETAVDALSKKYPDVNLANAVKSAEDTPQAIATANTLKKLNDTQLVDEFAKLEASESNSNNYVKMRQIADEVARRGDYDKANQMIEMANRGINRTTSKATEEILREFAPNEFTDEMRQIANNYRKMGADEYETAINNLLEKYPNGTTRDDIYDYVDTVQGGAKYHGWLGENKNLDKSLKQLSNDQLIDKFAELESGMYKYDHTNFDKLIQIADEVGNRGDYALANELYDQAEDAKFRQRSVSKEDAFHGWTENSMLPEARELANKSFDMNNKEYNAALDKIVKEHPDVDRDYIVGYVDNVRRRAAGNEWAYNYNKNAGSEPTANPLLLQDLNKLSDQYYLLTDKGYHNAVTYLTNKYAGVTADDVNQYVGDVVENNQYRIPQDKLPTNADGWEHMLTNGLTNGRTLANKVAGFSNDDLKNIAEVYQRNGNARKTIDDMLTEANFLADKDIMQKRAALADAERTYKQRTGSEPNGGYKEMLEPAKKKPVVKGPAYPEDVMNMKINRGEWGEPTGKEDYTEPTNERYSLNTDDDQGVKPRPDLYNEDVEVPDYTKPVDREGNTIKIEKRNWLQGAGEKFSRAGDRIENQDIYNALYSKTADRAIREGTVDTLKRLGYGPQDYGEAAKVSTAVNQMVDNMVENSRAKINDPDLIDNLRNIANDDSVVLSPAQEKKLNQQIRAITENLGQGDMPYTYDANKLLKESRRLISAGGKAITQSNYVNGQPQNTEKAEYGNQMIEMGRYLRQRAEEATNGLFDNKYTKEQVSAMLKNAGANQATIDYVTDSNSLSDLIKKTSTFEQARQMDREMKTTPYRRNGVAGSSSTNIVNRVVNRSGLGEVADLALAPVGKMTGAATKGIGNLMTKAGNAYAAVDQYPGLTDQGAITVANAAARNASNLASQQSNDQYYFDQNPETAQAAAAQFEAQNGLGGMNTQLGAQNGLTSGMMASQGQQYQDPAKTQFVDTLNRLAAGMQNALNAGDIKAYEQIANIYSQYAKIYSVQSELNGWNAAEEAEDEELTANQQKAQAAMQQLNQLASMQPDFGTAVSNVPILGNIVGMTGGNQYATQAAALEATLVNLLSGTSATESEREQIRRAYIPQFTDSDAVKQQKLQSAYQLIQNLYNSRNNWATQVDDYANGFFG